MWDPHSKPSTIHPSPVPTRPHPHKSTLPAQADTLSQMGFRRTATLSLQHFLMALFPILLLLLFLPLAVCGPVVNQTLYPGFTFTSFHFIDSAGVFLSSPNSTFSLAFYSPAQQQSRYYLYLIHSPSHSLVWSANPNTPVPDTATLSLSSSALSLRFSNRTLAWSTPPLPSPIHSLQLLESGNLVLLDSSSSPLWQSFDHPTHTLLPGQRLPSASSLASPASDSDFSDAGYRLLVTTGDVALRWRGSQQYWSLSLDPRSFKDSNTQAAYMEINATGMYLFDAEDRDVFRVPLPKTDGFRVGKMDSNGQFRIVTYLSTNAIDDFVAPDDACSLPLACNKLGLCPAGSNVSICSCPESFGQAKGGGCSPADGSALASPSSCSGASAVSYLSLGVGIGYFANRFANPIVGSDSSSCQDACSRNCSCLGFFYGNSSMACYLVQNQVGSLIGDSSTTMIGYVKTLKSSSSSSPSSPSSNGKSSTNIVPILLPLIATALLVLVLSFVGFRWWRKRNKKQRLLIRPKFPARETRREGEFSDSEEISIPGLPTRLSYADLELATDNFRTLIGSGGFGSVYKGELPDKSLIAVKKINNIGIQGKREFCTEIAVIGKIHHVNLVKLRGYCAQGSNRMLVYEYMNRGSLDRPLFGHGPALEWQERLEIAIGAARGLAYLHSGCDHKILHCDIKPENILLAVHGQVKIADFGMAKLMTPEQSGLFTTMRGTRGYLAPEWLTNSAISDKTDVYSYGMVLLEIIRGRKNRCNPSVASEFSASSGSSVEYFPMLAVDKHMEGRWLELADPRMQGRVTEAEVIRAVKVALCCLHEEPWMRPSMATVVGMLEGTMAVWEPKVEGLKFLRLYGMGSGGETEVAVGGGNYTGSESSTASASLLTHISSQEVSGPR